VILMDNSSPHTHEVIMYPSMHAEQKINSSILKWHRYWGIPIHLLFSLGEKRVKTLCCL